MSYAIGYVIYGFPYSEAVYKWAANLSEKEHNDICNKYDCGSYTEDIFSALGFTMVYSGSADYSGYFGTDIDKIDECSNVLVSKIAKPTNDIIEDVNKRYHELPNSLKRVIEKAFNNYPNKCPCSVYIVWGTS